MSLVWMEDQGLSRRRGLKQQRVWSHTVWHEQWLSDPPNVGPNVLLWTPTSTTDSMSCHMWTVNFAELKREHEEDEDAFALTTAWRIRSNIEMCQQAICQPHLPNQIKIRCQSGLIFMVLSCPFLMIWILRSEMRLTRQHCRFSVTLQWFATEKSIKVSGTGVN